MARSTTSRPDAEPSPIRFAMALPRARGHRGMDVFFSGLLDGLDTELQAAGGHLELLIVTSADEELTALRRWADRRLVAGVVLADLREDDPRLDLCREVGLPAVLVGVNDHPEYGGVRVDNEGATRLAVDYLVGLGHRSIGRVSGPARLRHTQQRDAAFAEALHAAGATGRTLEGDYGEASGYRATTELLTDVVAPTAIVYDNDVMAAAGLQCAAELGVSVPRELSLLAWDDSAVSRLTTPPLSVVSRDVRRLGALTAQALLAAGRGQVARLTLPSDAMVVARGTTSAAPR